MPPAILYKTAADGTKYASRISRDWGDVLIAWKEMAPFHAAGYTLFPLYANRKPKDKGWTGINYRAFFGPKEIKAWLLEGGNIGIRLEADDLVIDVDRHGAGDGVESLDTLLFDIDMADRCDAPFVVTGRSGLHIFFKKDPNVFTTINPKVPGEKRQRYPNIDFKKIGGYVVAAGSIHDFNGRMYHRAGKIGPAATPQASFKLLSLIERPSPKDRSGVGGELTCAQLAQFLAVLPASEHADYMDWIGLSAAAYDATNGDGFNEWADWCRSAEGHEDEPEEYLEQKWDSFEAGRVGGATYKKLLWAVIQAGRKDLVRVLGVSQDFDDGFEDDDGIVEIGSTEFPPLPE